MNVEKTTITLTRSGGNMSPDIRTIAQSGASAVSVYMRQVYQWMTVGLAVTAAVAYAVANSAGLQQAILGNSILMIALVVAQFGLVIALSAAVHKMSASTATGLFLLYSVLTGAMLSSVFVIYPVASIANAFLVTAGTFLAMSVYGTVTRRDLTAFGSFLIMGLFGLIIAMLVNLFLKNGMMDFIISCIGVLIFTGLTAYDTQKIRNFGLGAPLEDGTAMRRGAILGALTLYLDFINLFLMMLRFFGTSRD
jgi:FtsH-binding integral membrane protein